MLPRLVIGVVSAALFGCGAQVGSSTTDAGTPNKDATSRGEAADADLDAGLAQEDASTDDAWDLPDVDAAACRRDASAMNPTRPGACCVTQDDCQPGNEFLISCCNRNVCVYCGEK